MSDGLERDEVQQRLDQVVEELLAGAGVPGPPVDAIALAWKHLGLDVSFEKTRTDRAKRQSGDKQFVLSAHASEEHRQWTAAWTIGKHLEEDLRRQFGIDADKPRSMLSESLSRLFADRLLVPTRWLAEEAQTSGFDLLEMKQRFATASHERIAWRLLDLPEPCIITIIDDDRVQRRPSNAWRISRELSEAEWRCQRQVHSTGEPCELRCDGWSVQGWPAPLTGAKREVLRSWIDESRETQ